MIKILRLILELRVFRSKRLDCSQRWGILPILSGQFCHSVKPEGEEALMVKLSLAESRLERLARK
jgi:hypothetical protein